VNKCVAKYIQIQRNERERERERERDREGEEGGTLWTVKSL